MAKPHNKQKLWETRILVSLPLLILGTYPFSRIDAPVSTVKSLAEIPTESLSYEMQM